jgi:hypothetical protein
MPIEPQQNPPHDADEEAPPMFGSWRLLYALVLGELVLLILLLYFFRRAFE